MRQQLTYYVFPRAGVPADSCESVPRLAEREAPVVCTAAGKKRRCLGLQVVDYAKRFRSAHERTGKRLVAKILHTFDDLSRP